MSLFFRLFCDSHESFYARRNKFREHCTYVPTSNAIGCSVCFVSQWFIQWNGIFYCEPQHTWKVIYYLDLLPRTWKKEKKTGVPVFVIFSFLINTDTALSSGLFKTGGRILWEIIKFNIFLNFHMASTIQNWFESQINGWKHFSYWRCENEMKDAKVVELLRLLNLITRSLSLKICFISHT